MSVTPGDFEEMAPEELSARILDLACGRLSSNMATKFEAFVETRPALAEEFAYYRGLSAAARGDTQSPQADELGWARLNRAIDEEEMQQASAVENKPASLIPSAGISPLWRYAAVVLGLITCMQGVVLINGQTGFNDTRYVTVSEEDESFELKIIFQPDAKENTIRTLLRRTGGEIIAGPSAIGLYTVYFDTQEQFDIAIESYESAKEIIAEVSK